MSNTLEVRGVSLRFGGVRALTEVSFGVKEGELFSIIGPNGAGKTSILSALAGLVRRRSTSVFFQRSTAPHQQIRPDPLRLDARCL